MELGQTISVDEFISKKWNSFSEFSQYLESKKKPFMLNGEGVLYITNKDHIDPYMDTYYLFSINDRLFASAIRENLPPKQKDTAWLGVFRFHSSLLKSETFKNAKAQNYRTTYRKLEADVEVDCKGYDYSDEHKLLFSKASKVDLLYSHQLVLANNQTILRCQSYPSLKQTVHWQKMVNLVNERTERFIEQQKAKKEKEGKS
jgi:hypothetical protein